MPEPQPTPRQPALASGEQPRSESSAASIGTAEPTPQRRYRGRLFRKYLLLILSLVTIALLASGAISVYFSYQENKSALASLQHEKALAAASRIEAYIEQIVKQLSYAALPQLDASDIELRRIEFLKLLRQAPEVTDIAQLDSNGHEQIAVSRLGMDSINSGKDRSQEPAFRNSKRGKPWFGPVYFKKETEPYMTIGIRSGNDTGPVTVADVNLKFIWDVVSRIKIGEKGKAYVVDGNGFLVADPDIGLVLRKTDLSQLPHVKKVLEKQNSDDPTTVSTDLAGVSVLTSVAPIESLSWDVFVEQPVSEVFAKLNASIVRTALLLLAGLLLSAIGALALARGMVRPIRTLDVGAQRIGAGELDQKIEIHTGDELEALANQFNRMTGRLRESYAGLEHKVEARTHELKNSLDQQTAISEILRVIASSPGDVRPMLNAVAERALKLCDSTESGIFLVDGDALRFTTGSGNTPTFDEGEMFPLNRGSMTGRAVMDGVAIHMEDLAAASEEEFPLGREMQRRIGHRTALAVPLMREDRAIGAFALWRMEARPFTEKQIALVKTFADQAAIAIENVRLFNATKEALEQQTAVAEILRVISSSPTDVQPVLDEIAERAAQLCDASAASMYLTDGETLRHLASKGPAADPVSHVDSLPINRDSISGRALLERRTIEVDDMLAQGSEYPLSLRIAQRSGHRTVVVVPLYREGKPFGTILLRRQEVRRFNEREIALLQTFGDQAAIALENVRLFNETKEALDQQRASGEILATISSSIADTKPVFDAILQSCQRLFSGHLVGLMLVRDDGMLDIGAYQGPGLEYLQRLFPLPISREMASGIAILDQRVVTVPDIDAADVPILTEKSGRMVSYKSITAAPLIFEGRGIGALWVARSFPGSLTDKQLTLLKTFADQAVIAIQNARLLNEIQEGIAQRRASVQTLDALTASATDTAPVFEKILESCERLFAGKLVGINLVGDDGLVRIGAYHGPGREELEAIFPAPVDDSTGSGAAILRRAVLHFPNVETGENVPTRTIRGCNAIGVKAVIFAPMLWEAKAIGTIFVGRDYVGPFSDKDIALLKTFADQAVIAIQNARLLREIQEKSRQVEIASQHKMQFLANMSHELRTPLNAILGYSELLFDGIYGALEDRVRGVLERVQHNGKHLLGLINDVLDLSKIDAGQLRLAFDEYSMASLVKSTLASTESLAQAKGLALECTIADGLPMGYGDERRLTQVLLNIVGNAIKFTDEGGVTVTANAGDGFFVVNVRDTGLGIALADQGRIFEEFQQVDVSSTRRKGGTGLGLAIARRIVEMHGGKISLESNPGAGSTFQIVVPVRVQQQKEAA
jgi:signal transduction histidine kinase